MKKCPYCGKEYADDALRCVVDDQLLTPETPILPLPVDEEQKEWIEKSFKWLLETFSREVFLKHKTILPETSFFPDKYDGTEKSVDLIVERVCNYMEVNPRLVEVGFLVGLGQQESSSERLVGERSQDGAAGLYYAKAETETHNKILINVLLFKNPTKLVGTIAHELGHVILLGGGKITRDRKDHEYLTDLLTVFLGLGIFTANSAFQFSQWQDNTFQGWRVSRTGYMTEEMYGYSLAMYAWLRNERKPFWAKYLSQNVAHYLKQSLMYFENGGPSLLCKATV